MMTRSAAAAADTEERSVSLQLAVLRNDLDAVATTLLAGDYLSDSAAPPARRRFARHSLVEPEVLEVRPELEEHFADVHLLFHLAVSDTPLSVLALLAPDADDSVLSLLLAAGAADATAWDANGLTALHWLAQRTASAEVLLPLGRALVSAGADLEAREAAYGASPLAWSGWHGCPGAASVFLTLGAERDSRDAFGGTPAGWAVANGHTAAAAVLCEQQQEADDEPGAHQREPSSYRVSLQVRHAERMEATARGESAWALHLLSVAMEECTGWPLPGPARTEMARLLMAQHFALWPPRTRPL